MAETTKASASLDAHYAGFWVRFVAACIDLILYTPLYVGMRYAFDFGVGHMLGAGVADTSIDFAGGTAKPGDIYRWWFEGLFAVVALASYAWFFSAKWQGSLGMYLLKFRITDTEGKRISFMRAFSWCITGTVGWLICCAGILYLQKDIIAVKDMLVSCQEQNVDVLECIPEIEKVIGIPYSSFEQLMYAAVGLTFFMFLIWALSIALPKDKTGFHNLICGTRFLRGRP